MERIDLIKRYYDMEMNNVFSYSANWLMTIPKKGFEKEFEEANMRADILKEMISEMEEHTVGAEGAFRMEK